MGTAVQEIPKSLIYEMVDGKPIYYKGYEEYLKGNLQIEEIVGSSLLQSAIITGLLVLLYPKYGDKYHLLSNELGILFRKNSWRSADLVIIEKEKLGAKILENKYLDIAPKVVVEIDTKADLSEIEDTFGYYHKKTKQLLSFGVEKVVWIYTDLQSVLIADQEDWQIIDWDKDFLIMPDLEANISKIVGSLKG
ncbi:MAG: Uma2 family endonuclease [Phaeodactylibacter sp.]|nr:Uma2 family endonuclease [Phaeodactylibacter sp.]